MALGNGEPANDVAIPTELIARLDLDGRWKLGIGGTYIQGELERPTALVGLTPLNDGDSVDADAQIFGANLWAERDFWSGDDKNDLFGMFGVGVNSVSVDDASGPLAGGGNFNVTTDAGLEFLSSVGIGYRRRITKSFSYEGLVRYDYHAADWKLRDTDSGASAPVDDYGTLAFLFGVSYSF